MSGREELGPGRVSVAARRAQLLGRSEAEDESGVAAASTQLRQLRLSEPRETGSPGQTGVLESPAEQSPEKEPDQGEQASSSTRAPGSPISEGPESTPREWV